MGGRRDADIRGRVLEKRSDLSASLIAEPPLVRSVSLKAPA
jgi:hypothetical protein